MSPKKVIVIVLKIRKIEKNKPDLCYDRANRGVFTGKEGSGMTKGNEQGARFTSAEEFRAAADAYFDACDKSGKLYGEAGLALHLGVSLCTLRRWYDGEQNTVLQGEARRAYLRIQDQIETHPAYMEKGGMVSRGIFLQKQARFGGYQDKIEANPNITVNVKMGENMDASDFK